MICLERVDFHINSPFLIIRSLNLTQTLILKTLLPMSFLIDPDDFRIYFPERIFERGYSYWSSEAIAHLTDVGSGNLMASVIGSEIYLVRISPAMEGMVMCRCSCPYAEDAPCKHIAAVLLELEELEVDFNGDEPGDEDRGSKSGSFVDLLGQASQDQMAGFIRSVCEADPLLHHKFMAYMTPGDSSAGKLSAVQHPEGLKNHSTNQTNNNPVSKQTKRYRLCQQC